MPDFAALVPETHQNISPDLVEALFQTRREESFTGLMRLSHLSGENLVFTFLEGTQQKLYRCLENTTEVIPSQSWFDALDHAHVNVGFLGLPVEGLRFTRIAHEAPVIRAEKSTFVPEELTGPAGKWAMEQDPSIVHVQGEKLNRYYLIAGHSAPIIEELSFVEGAARFSIGDASFPQALPQQTYSVVRYVSNQEHEVWREHELRLAFNPLMRMMINRFSELAGCALTERLCNQLSLWAQEGGWHISITTNGVVNRHYFDTLERAVGVYAEILRHFREEASSALGSRMVDGISREILMKLDAYRGKLLTQYLYGQYGVGSVAGVVWR